MLAGKKVVSLSSLVFCRWSLEKDERPNTKDQRLSFQPRLQRVHEKREDVVALDVRFGALTDGTSYTAETAFEAKAKNIRVVIQNSGHKPLAQ